MRIKNLVKGLVLSTVLATLMWGCSTDIDVSADWRDQTVVFGLLDPSDSLHYIKITKAFNGDDDANNMAQVRDSSEYSSIRVEIQSYKGNQLVGSYLLKDTVIATKESGTFYAPEQKLYYFAEKQMDRSAKYKLIATIFPGTAKEKIVTAETEIVDDFVFSGTIVQLAGTFSLADFTEIKNPLVQWNVANDGVRYQVNSIFHYENEFTDGSVEKKTIEYGLGQYIYDPTKATMSTEFGAETFYCLVGNEVPVLAESPANLKQRWVKSLDFYVTAAGEELHTYMEVNEPSTGIVQDKREYTNVTNGIGIFSSRTTIKTSVTLSKSSIEELMFGTILSTKGCTGDRLFCDPNLGALDPNSCYN